MPEIIKNINTIKAFSKELADVSQTKGTATFYFAMYRTRADKPDLHNDRILAGAFNRTVKNNFKNIVHLVEHKNELFVGTPNEFFVNDAEGALVESQFNLSSTFAADQFANYLFLHSKGLPIYHSFKASGIGYENNEGGYDIVEYKLLEEYSKVIKPADLKTNTLSVKSIEDLLTFDDAAEYISEMLDFPYSDVTKYRIEKLEKIINTYKSEQRPTPEPSPESTVQNIVTVHPIDFLSIVQNLNFKL